MNIFPSGYGFMVTITDITGDIATGTVTASSRVTIYYTTKMTTPTILYASTMASGIGLLESRIFRAKTITTTFVVFVAIRTRRVSIIIFIFLKCGVYFSNRNVSESSPKSIIENFPYSSLTYPQISTGPYLAYELSFLIRQGYLG